MANKKNILLRLGDWFGLAASLMLMGCVSAASTPALKTPIRIGWQTTWATEGQITQTLAHTDLLNSNGLEGSFVGVTYGAPLNEAALAGNVDVIFTADQPAAALLARGGNWVIIGRLMFNRVGLYVPPDSSIKTIADLKGKRVVMPFGAAAQRVALRAMANAGLNPKTDIKAINLDITEQPAIVQKGTSASWGDVDAMAGFDPTVAALETNKTARMLYIGVVTAVIVMSRDYVAKHPDAPVQFLKAFKQAVLYYALHAKRANDWFRAASQLTFSDAVLDLSASVEPNLQAKNLSEVHIDLTPDLIAGLQEAADFMNESGLIKQPVRMADHIDLSYAQKATEELASTNFNVDAVQLRSGQ